MAQKSSPSQPAQPSGYMSNKDSMGGYGQLYPVGVRRFAARHACLAGFWPKDRSRSVLEAGALQLDIDQVCERLNVTPRCRPPWSW